MLPGTFTSWSVYNITQYLCNRYIDQVSDNISNLLYYYKSHTTYHNQRTPVDIAIYMIANTPEYPFYKVKMLSYMPILWLLATFSIIPECAASEKSDVERFVELENAVNVLKVCSHNSFTNIQLLIWYMSSFVSPGGLTHLMLPST